MTREAPADMSPEDRIRWIYASGDQAELSRRYDAWAATYDHQLTDDLGYIGPRIAVDMLRERLPTEARILDAGCGTGLAGEALHAAGYRDIVGVDFSPGMLAEARSKAVYSALLEQDLLAPVAFESDRFDAVVSVGVFTFGHVTAEAFDELIRVTRPGGLILFSVLVRFLESGGFRERLDALERAGRWTPVEIGRPFASRREVDADASGVALIYRVC